MPGLTTPNPRLPIRGRDRALVVHPRLECRPAVDLLRDRRRAWGQRNASSTCLVNQVLHGQSESLSSLVGPKLVAPGTGSGRDPSLFDRRSMSQWAAHITVPVFISRRARGRPDRTAVAGAAQCISPLDAGVRHHGQRRPHRLDRPADHESLARIPGPVRGRRGAPHSRGAGRYGSSTRPPASPLARKPRHPCRPCGSPTPPRSPRPARTSPRTRHGSTSSSTAVPEPWVPGSTVHLRGRVRAMATDRQRSHLPPHHRGVTDHRGTVVIGERVADPRPRGAPTDRSPAEDNRGPPIRRGTGRPCRHPTPSPSRLRRCATP